MALPRAAEELLVDGLHGDGRHGLWVYGPRKSGTTTTVRKFYDEHQELFSDKYAVKRTAGWVEKKIRMQWDLNKTYAKGGDDIPLLNEIRQTESQLDLFFDTDIVWLDDLYTEYEESFVRKNILLRLDTALKGGQTVFVSGTSAPEFYGSDWERAIRAMYVVVNLSDGTR